MTNIPCLTVADIELPRDLKGLYDLAYNFWWSWNPRARRLLSSVDAVAWSTYRNPVEMLINVEPSHWEPMMASDTFASSYSSLMKQFEGYMDPQADTWFRREVPEGLPGPVAYFCMEYGLHECFNMYSGGLGVLSGDHLKSASDLGLPLVGVGLLYRRGYFRQAVDADGRQQHHYPRYDFTRLPIRPAASHTGGPVVVEVELPNRTVAAQVWVAQVGRVPLVLLSTDLAQNDPADRPITDILYVRGREMRLNQEIVLGVGGVRALRALGIAPSVWHLNEGHSAFLQLERLREEMPGDGSLAERLPAVRRNTVFTTHTPVSAGNEQFERPLARKYLAGWSQALHTTPDEILALGDATGSGSDNFNLTALALRSSVFANGVSKLHGDVSRDMWRELLTQEGRPAEEGIGAITNGIHSTTWLGLEMQELFSRYLGPGWVETLLTGEGWEKVMEIPDQEIWRAHLDQKDRLRRFLRLSLRRQFARHGQSPDELREVEDLFGTDVLTLGFARRFATYKRAKLVFSDVERLKTLVSHVDRPVQIVLAGKAHPADLPGQALIEEIFRLSQSDVLRGLIFFLEDYDMRVGSRLVQGVDVWLNNPRRPMEASGTSGQKSAANGGLNLSVLDGWWPEAYDGDNGWTIGQGESFGNEGEADENDARALYDVLEQQVVPLYYDRDEGGLPREWIRRMKRSIASITPQFSSARMVSDYARRAYLPAARTAPEPDGLPHPSPSA